MRDSYASGRILENRKRGDTGSDESQLRHGFEIRSTTCYKGIKVEHLQSSFLRGGFEHDAYPASLLHRAFRSASLQQNGELLYISQPSLTQHISKLEKELGGSAVQPKQGRTVPDACGHCHAAGGQGDSNLACVHFCAQKQFLALSGDILLQKTGNREKIAGYLNHNYLFMADYDHRMEVRSSISCWKRGYRPICSLCRTSCRSFLPSGWERVPPLSRSIASCRRYSEIFSWFLSRRFPSIAI